MRLTILMAVCLVACSQSPQTNGQPRSGSGHRTVEPPTQAVFDVKSIAPSAVSRRVVENPDVWEVKVLATNLSDSSVTFRRGSCAHLVRVYTDSARTHLVWLQEHAKTPFGCDAVAYQVTIAAGEVREIDHVILAASHILGDSLPPRRYYLSVRLDYEGQVLEVPGGLVNLRK